MATIALATASICCSPPDSSPARRSISGRRAGSSVSARSVAAALVLTRATQPELEVLGDGQAEEQRAVLRHVTHAPAGHLVR